MGLNRCDPIKAKTKYNRYRGLHTTSRDGDRGQVLKPSHNRRLENHHGYVVVWCGTKQIAHLMAHFAIRINDDSLADWLLTSFLKRVNISKALWQVHILLSLFIFSEPTPAGPYHVDYHTMYTRLNVSVMSWWQPGGHQHSSGPSTNVTPVSFTCMFWPSLLCTWWDLGYLHKLGEIWHGERQEKQDFTKRIRRLVEHPINWALVAGSILCASLRHTSRQYNITAVIETIIDTKLHPETLEFAVRCDRAYSHSPSFD